MRLAGARILCSVAALLLLHSSQGADPCASSLQGHDHNTGPQVLRPTLPTEHVLDLVACMEDLSLTKSAASETKASVPSKDGIESFDELITIGSTIDLADLESLLKERRALAGDNPDLIAEHENTASIIMTECPALADAKTAVQSALENQYYEVLRCLQRHPIWKNSAQERWYWGMIADTPVFNPAAWMDELRGLVFKKDTIEYYAMMRYAASLNELSKDEVCEYIVMFDSINILTNLYPTMIEEVAENVDLIVEYSPARLINQLIPPYAVKSAQQLQRLFDSGYDQIPKFCLRLKNSVPTIRTDCAKWLTENNCLSLVKEMFQHKPDFKYDSNQLYMSAIGEGSLDVAKWLHDKKGMQCPCEYSVIGATRKGHLKTIEWIVDEFKNQIDWKAVIKGSYSSWRSHKAIDYIESKVNVTLKPEIITLYRLAAKGDLTGLEAAYDESPGDFPWQYVADGAARGGHADIVQWVRDNSNGVLPTSGAVQDACEMGNFSVLKKVYEIYSTRVVSGYDDGYISATKCLLYAAMHNKSEEMGWILNGPLKDKLPSMLDMYHYVLYDIDVPEEAYLRAFKQIAETNGRVVVNQEMMLRAARWGHVKVFQWLREQGLAITAEVAMEAVGSHKVEILKAIHAINLSLVCAVEIANEAVRCHGVLTHDVLDWMWKTCKILPTRLGTNVIKEWVEERKHKQ